MIRAALLILALLPAATALAQRSLSDPDDYLDPRETEGRPVLISRIVIGGASNMSGDGFRPLGDLTGYVHLTTHFYWRSMQFDYKRSEMRADDAEAAQWVARDTPGGVRLPDDYVQTSDATPKSKDTLHAAWYWPVPAGGGIPVMLRSRLTYSTQTIDNEFHVPDFSLSKGLPQDEIVQISATERTLVFDTDTWFRIRDRDVFGSLAFSRTKTTGEVGARNERALTYTNRFPALSYDRASILFRPTLTVGGISNRAGGAVNLVNPAIEIFRPFLRSGTNLHVIYSPQWTRNEGGGKTTHQVAVFIDRALFVKRF